MNMLELRNRANGDSTNTESTLVEQLKKQQAEKVSDMLNSAIDAQQQTPEQTPGTAFDELQSQYEYEHEPYMSEGFNIGDSLARRRITANENVKNIKEELIQEDIEKELLQDVEEDVDSTINTSSEERISDKKTLDVEEYIDEVEKEILGGNNMENNDELVVVAVPQKVTQSIETLKPETMVETTQINAIPEPVIVADKVKPVEEIVTKIDPEDIDIEEEVRSSTEVNSDDEIKDAIDRLRSDLASKLNTVVAAPDAAVSKKPVSLNNVLMSINGPINQTADWVLISAGKLITMKTFTGIELDALNRNASGRNRFNTLKEIFHSIYSHILSDKPAFDVWLKESSFFDIEHLYMAIYAACFTGKNYIPYNCEDENCRHPFLSDNIDLSDMMWFDPSDPTIKDRFEKIKESTDIKDVGLYKSKIEQIWGPIGIKFREPSIYDTVFEQSVLDESFVSKYRDLIRLLVYIDSIYLLSDGEWHPVTYANSPDDMEKTTKTKIVTYSKIINGLPSDAYQKINKIINDIDILGNKIKYRLPETVCPKCGKPVSYQLEQALTEAIRLVFSRHHLNLNYQQ